jgi:hypothetical protein
MVKLVNRIKMYFFITFAFGDERTGYVLALLFKG